MRFRWENTKMLTKNMQERAARMENEKGIVKLTRKPAHMMKYGLFQLQG